MSVVAQTCYLLCQLPFLVGGKKKSLLVKDQKIFIPNPLYMLESIIYLEISVYRYVETI